VNFAAEGQAFESLVPINIRAIRLVEKLGIAIGIDEHEHDSLALPKTYITGQARAPILPLSPELERDFERALH
jgi:hypothetical protein